MLKQVVNQKNKNPLRHTIKIPKLIIFPTMNDCLKIIGNEIMEI